MTWTVTVGNKKMAGTCTSDHAQLEYNSHKLLRNLLAAILFPKSRDLVLLSPYTALMHTNRERPLVKMLNVIWEKKFCIRGGG